MIEIVLYDTRDDKCPVQEFLDSLEPKLLANGFTKKTQKTPKTEIDLAKKYRDDYERRHRYEQL